MKTQLLNLIAPVLKKPFMSRMIGSINESFIFSNGQTCTALIDTGSEVTTICEEFIKV